MIPIHDLNPRRTPPVVTVALIVVNALFFLYELSLGQRIDGFFQTVAFIPARAGDGLPEAAGSALVSMFLHGGWAHLLGNLLFLWVFGDNVEDRLGHFRFLLFYLLAGYAATGAHYAFSPGSTIPAIGASGAISGVLGAYLFLHPKARIVTVVWLFVFLKLIEIPALVYLPIWFGLQLLSGLTSLGAESAASGGVAWWAHIGGFVAGPVLLLLLGGRRDPPEPERRRLVW
ncbi:MAG TPA: rhomboid family intramembrane serine protease [Acidobacteria bacterium]|nr:rhomboid family intramembrane serine protease [Acidobacteriota bacterium]